MEDIGHTTRSTPPVPTRRSPRIAGQEPPPIEHERRVRQREEGFATVSPAPHPGRRTRSLTRAIRDKQTNQKRRSSPHSNDEGNPGGTEAVMIQVVEKDGECKDAEEDDNEMDCADETAWESSSSTAKSALNSAEDVPSSSEEYIGEETSANPTQLLVELSVDPVYAPKLQTSHANWGEWAKYLKEYAASTHQVIVVFETMRVSQRNQRIAKQKAPGTPIPLELSPYSRVYRCTHGPKPKNRGTGQRPRRFLRFTGCPMRFRVQWFQRDKTWVLEVTPVIMWHNHVIGPAYYGTYPVARGIKDPATLIRADEMVTDGARRAAVYDMLLSKGENVYKADVDNLVSAHRSRVSRRDDDGAAAQIVADFVNNFPDGAATVDEADRGETGVISLTTPHMRIMFMRFGELLLVDCTHKTNRYNYQLCTFMVMDEYGCGQVVQQSLFETNGDWHMQRAIRHLMRVNPDSWKLVRVIMVDKDLNEIKVLKSLFDEARILICHFHVLKYLDLMAHKPEFGKLTKSDHETLELVMRELVFADSEIAYVHNKVVFERTCHRMGFGTFAQYVADNWFNEPELWVMYHRAKLPHLKNHTNNRLENWFGKFKKGVDENCSMAGCLQALIKSARRCENDYDFETKRVGRYYNANYDEEMSNVLLCTTPFVAEAIKPQYTTAINKFGIYSYELLEKETQVIVKSKRKEHVVNLLDWTCECIFAKSMRLPCRHAMAWRKFNGQQVIPLKAIDLRWKRSSPTQPPVRTFQFNRAGLEHGPDAVTKRNASLGSQASRYNEALRLLKPICSELADIEDIDEFHEYIQFLLIQFRNIRQAKRLRVCVEAPLTTGVSTDSNGCLDGPKTHVSPDRMELSQTNSLWSEDIGDVPDPRLNELHIPSPSVLVCCDVEEKADGQVLENPGEYMVTAPVSLEMHDGEDDTHASSKGGDNTGQEERDDVKIKINQKTTKVGRPKKNRKVADAAKRKARVVFNAARLARNELTMKDVVEAVDAEQPTIRELKNRLAGFKVRYEEHERKRPKYARIQNPTLDHDVYYILPPTLLAACVKVLPTANTLKDAIDVRTPSSSNHSNQRLGDETDGGSKDVDVVSCNGIGTFSREQIELMRRVENLLRMCNDGEKFIEWMKVELSTHVPAVYQEKVLKLASQIAATYPAGPIPGLGARTEYHVANVFSIKPPAWLNDGVILAFCYRLEGAYHTVRCAGSASVKKTHNTPRLEQATYDMMGAWSSDDDVSIVVLPINMSNFHWVCIYVDKKAKIVSFYDSLHSPTTRHTLSALADTLIGSSNAPFPLFTKFEAKTPIQQDGYSCGLFVCFQLWRAIDKSVSIDMADYSLWARRFELLQFVFNGVKVSSVDSISL